jgi:hypothetical protein
MKPSHINKTQDVVVYHGNSQRPAKLVIRHTSFVVMTQEHITQAFTSDHHFEQAGFVKLL